VTLREKVIRRRTPAESTRHTLAAVLRSAACLLAALSLLAFGCGGETPGADPDDASLMLDFTPNAVHAGIYQTLARDYDEAEKITLRVRTPGDSTDSIRLLETGRVDFAILDISDLALAREGGADVKAIMAFVQRPLAAVFAKPGIERPRDLEGKRAGVSGLPSDVAVLESTVKGDGGDPAKVKQAEIGFTAVPSLVGGKVDAVTAFWNVEGLALKDELDGVREFRVEQFGAPAYPELVLVASAQTLQDDPGRAERVVKALRRGYEETLIDPESAVESMTRRVKGLDRAATLAQLQAVQPAFMAGVKTFGVLDPARLEKWADWAAEFGIVKKAPDVGAAFVTRYADAGS
jgi:putative hydroxymethylpyrimidine transport system substrate-binding protein